MRSGFVWDHPFASFWMVILAVALPLLVLTVAGATGRGSRWEWWYGRLVLATACAIAASVTARYLLAAVPAVDGVDFYFYLCFGRDLLHGVADPGLAKYAYFPGGYRFWEFVMAVSGEDLATLRIAFVATLAANAALCGLIVARGVNSPGGGVLAGVWYLILASRFEGLDGTTEPISTLFALLGVLAWGGMPLSGSRGWYRALLLGAGLGLAAWVKQQGGLVAIGAGAIAFEYAMNPAASRHRPMQMLAVPAAAIGTFVLAVLLEGHGMAPVLSGIRAVGEYEPIGSLAENLQRPAQLASVAGVFFAIILLVWFAISGFPGNVRRSPWFALAGFSVLATLATLIQYAKRDTPHYALLAVPFLTIAVIAVTVRMIQLAGRALPRLKLLIGIAVTGLLLNPGIVSLDPIENFQVWPLVSSPVVSMHEPWHERDQPAADIRSIAHLVSPGENVLILPPRRNAIHYLLGTRSLANPHGYGWGPQDASQTIGLPSLDAVLVLGPRILEAGDTQNCRMINCERAISALPENGFRVAATRATMTLWRRP